MVNFSLLKSKNIISMSFSKYLPLRKGFFLKFLKEIEFVGPSFLSDGWMVMDCGKWVTGQPIVFAYIYIIE